MNAAEKKTCDTIESALMGNSAYRKIEDKMYVVKQGSSYVMITVVPWGEDRDADGEIDERRERRGRRGGR